MSEIKQDIYEALDKAVQKHYAMLCSNVDRESLRIHLGYSFPGLGSKSLDCYVSQLRKGNRKITKSLAACLDGLLGSSYKDIQVLCYRQVYEDLEYHWDLIKDAPH